MSSAPESDSSAGPDAFDRRRFLQIGAGSLAAASVPFLPADDMPACEETSRVAAGPFYPGRDRSDEDTDLTRIDGRSDQARGRIIRVWGRVLDEECEPVEGALVEIWQADANGRYHHKKDDRDKPIDPAFQGWGESVTGPDGEYGFKTVKPAPYPAGDGMRTPHIHFRAVATEHHELITQLFFEGEELNESDGVLQDLNPEERDRVVLRPQSNPEPEGDEYDEYRFDLNLIGLRTDLVSQSALRRYAGSYRLQTATGDAARIDITQEGHRLYAKRPGLTRKVELMPVSGNRFDASAFGGEEVRFDVENGTITVAVGDGEPLNGQKIQ